MLVVFGILLSSVQAQFPRRIAFNEKGDIQIIGNTLMTCIDDATTGGGVLCQDAQNGVSPAANNNFAMRYVDIDADATTFNSSSADFRATCCREL